ncbi:MAG: outer membrane beta-barrel protein [Candidatus Korobacteraceae bacterium]
MAEFLSSHGRKIAALLLVVGLAGIATQMKAQESATPSSSTDADQQIPPAVQKQLDALQKRIEQLEAEVNRLNAQGQTAAASAASSATAPAHGTEDSVAQSVVPSTSAQPAQGNVLSADDRAVLDYLKGTTINVMLDGYYGYNFNDPYNRVNLLRAYDVLSNSFSLNQADVVFERAPDLAAGRRWGTRLDLQFGQATETLQGNPANELRPDVYRNVFQAYGTYVVPLGSGLTVDFGKWASSLGIEGNYTKDQINYSRSYWFDFLPFYHMGFRTNYKINDKLAVNYWLVNGAQQSEDFNGFKDQMFGFVVTPKKTITWTMNYYFGQEHPNVVQSANCGPVPVQPGLCLAPITPAPDGKLHIFDSYVSWQATPKLLLQLEGDYVIERLWANAAPRESSAPSHTTGGAAYAQYQFTPKYALGARTEYLSDRGGLFSGVTEALKEVTLTNTFNVADGFQLRAEWRRDWSNVPVFFTGTPDVFSKDQNTATLGMIWWFGRKQGAW